MSEAAERNAALVRGRTALIPKIAVVLGSGLGAFVHALESPVSLRYSELEGFPTPAVSGHLGSLSIGRIGGAAVAVLAGRSHYYENGRSDVMRAPLETLRTIGVETLVLTNAAGSVRKEIPPGSVMLITDHINFGNRNPLVGEQSAARFVGMTSAYDPMLIRAASEAAAAEGETLARGVYMWFSGPSFETPAEIRAASTLGADAVGMSTVPEVILARFLGLKVLAFSVITNFAAGMTGAELSHEETMATAPLGGAKLQRILKRILAASGQAQAA